jgi:hypothetical protein
MRIETKHQGNLAEVEAARLAAQWDFDKRVPGSERNRLGQFATPWALAEAMVRLARGLFPEIKRVRFLDPALGTGVFHSALLRVYRSQNIISARGFEIDPRLAAVAKQLWGPMVFKSLCRTSHCRAACATATNPPDRVTHPRAPPPSITETKTRPEHAWYVAGGPPINGLTGLATSFPVHQWLAKDGGAGDRSC